MATPLPAEDNHSFDPRLRFNDSAGYEGMIGRWASALDALDELWRKAGLVDVQKRQFEVRREFGSSMNFGGVRRGVRS